MIFNCGKYDFKEIFLGDSKFKYLNYIFKKSSTYFQVNFLENLQSNSQQ